MALSSLRSALAGIAILVGGILAATCSDTGLLPSTGYLALGTRGGDNVAVIAADSVTHVHVGCTFGDMPGRIPLDAGGRFTGRRDDGWLNALPHAFLRSDS